MVLHPPIALRELRGLVDEVAGEEEVVPRGDGEGVAHEGGRVDGQGAGHAAGDPEGVLDGFWECWRPIEGPRCLK